MGACVCVYIVVFVDLDDGGSGVFYEATSGIWVFERVADQIEIHR